MTRSLIAGVQKVGGDSVYREQQDDQLAQEGSVFERIPSFKLQSACSSDHSSVCHILARKRESYRYDLLPLQR